METKNNVQLNLSIPERYRSLLRRMAAERVMENPNLVATGSSIATELLMSALNDIGKFDDEEGGKEND
ncbi:MAG: hypothetical protein QUS13_07210 [Smithella sp.]|nr:hypothetical protein [Smithella sp.]